MEPLGDRLLSEAEELADLCDGLFLLDGEDDLGLGECHLVREGGWLEIVYNDAY